MTERRTFWRKVVYITAMVVLLIPLSFLSMPASSGPQGPNPGGLLARMRSDYGLSQANLGEIDPASEAMKLATLGMRGIAVNRMWEKAIHYKKVEDWSNFEAMLEQIRHLQPNFITVWQYQAWNLSYNLSVEFDDYRDRYRWVKRGIEYLQEGLKYNKDEPRLLWDTGWFIGNKIGTADEKRQYRRLFKEDDEFHANSDLPKEQRDNWLVGKSWFVKAIEADANGIKRMKGKGPLIFKADPGLAQINYASALDVDGVHGQTAQRAWIQAAKDWHTYGEQNILHSDGTFLQLNDLERMQAEAEKNLQAINSLQEGVAAELLREKLATLTPDERKLVDMKSTDVPPEQIGDHSVVQSKIKVTPEHIADRIQATNPKAAIEAARLARAWMDADRLARNIDAYRSIVNFNYWRERCELEQRPETLKVRELTYQAQVAHEKQDLVRSRQLYEEAWVLWRKVFDEFTKVFEDGLLAEDLVEHIARYRAALEDQSVEFPQDFILRDVVERFDRQEILKDLFIKRDDGQPEDGEKKPAADSPEKEASPAKPGDVPKVKTQLKPPEPLPFDEAAKQKAARQKDAQQKDAPPRVLEEGAPPEPPDADE